MRTTKLRSLLAIPLVTAVALLGCGGGGPSLNIQPTPTGLQGIFQGNATQRSLSLQFDAMVLPDGSFYAIYCNLSSDQTLCYLDGVMIGQGSTGANNSYNIASLFDYEYNGQTYGASAAATFVPNQSMSGTIAENSTSIPFAANLVPNTQFNFGSPASLNSIVGTWTGSTVRTDFPSTLQVNADGTFTSTYGSGATSCNVTGKFVPNATNNYFTLTVSFSTNIQNIGSVCSNNGLTANGIAVVFGSNNKFFFWGGFAISGTGYGNAFALHN